LNVCGFIYLEKSVKSHETFCQVWWHLLFEAHQAKRSFNSAAKLYS